MISLKDCPVPHLQVESEWDEFIEKYVVPLNPKTVVEIGSFYGATLWSFIVNCPSLEIIVSVDLPITPDDHRYPQMIKSRKKWKTWKLPPIEIIADSHLPSTLEDTKRVVNDVDVLFIDGDHSYKGLKMDYEMYSPLVREGGIVAIHDHLYYANSVAKFVEELKPNVTYEEINHTNSLGIFIIKK